MQPISVEEFKNLIKDGILVYDGAMGTNLIAQGLSLKDYGDLEGCSEALNLFCPQSVIKVHKSFIEAGCQVIETNTFGGTRITLKEYGLENRVAEINRLAVEMARTAINEVAPPYRALIAGSIGPTSQLPSLGNIGFDDMADAFYEQMDALWLAGVDIFQIETCQDLLQIKAALYALESIFAKYGARRPVMVSVTLEPSGTMLMGSDVDAIVTVLEPYRFIDVLGVNCATGPLEMERHVAHLVEYWPGAVGVMPNAGLPENVDGKPFYRMTPDEFASFQKRFVEKYGVRVVGGCCGTRPEHLCAVVNALRGSIPANRMIQRTAKVASLFNAVSLRQQPAPALVGERTNANGARQFKDLLVNNDWEGMTSMGREQARGGAHLVDLCVAYVGRDEVADMQRLVPMFATQVNLPLVIDSTSPEAVEAALKRHGGRCVINSVNLEDGGARLKQIAGLARRFGAALICLTIDEDGMAKSSEKKVAVALRIRDILVSEFGFRDSDLIFDTLTFTVASGDSELRKSAGETLQAIRLLSQKLPTAHTILGVSNVSFGLKNEARELLNSVFLNEAVAAGLSCAIVNPAKILPLHSINEKERQLALDLLNNVRGDGSELTEFMNAFAVAGDKRKNARAAYELAPAEQLFEKVVDGDAAMLAELINLLRLEIAPEEIINNILLPAMKQVGELFGSGKLQLPFVLQSAEVVKKTVALLEPHMEKAEADPAKKMILATVAGDVHDIGKNLVNIMLSNNGFTVVDLGIKIDIDTMIRAAQKASARVIGMSGLLVRSTQIMKENLQELNRRDFLPAVILGGAALTEDFVQKELVGLYKGKVFYARDAVDSIKIMQQLVSDSNSQPKPEIRQPVKPVEKIVARPLLPEDATASANRYQFAGGRYQPEPPFIGARVIEIDSSRLFALMSHKVLYEARWGYKKLDLNSDQYDDLLEKEARPALNRFIELDRQENLFQAQAVYGYFNCLARGDSLEIFDDAEIKIAQLSFPRQKNSPFLCMSDYFSDKEFFPIPLWLVTLGEKPLQKGKSLLADDEFCNYHLLHGLAAELADCAAVYLHRHMHSELFVDDPLTDGQPYGCRYSFGYPSCPDLASNKELVRILNAGKIGVSLTESFQMVPELSVSGFLVLNKLARYFVP